MKRAPVPFSYKYAPDHLTFFIRSVDHTWLEDRQQTTQFYMVIVTLRLYSGRNNKSFLRLQ